VGAALEVSGNLIVISKISALKESDDRQNPGSSAYGFHDGNVIGRAASATALPIAGLQFRRIYFGACTKIRVAVMVKVPLMLGMALPSRP
jgi:hypothetical protein